MMRVSSKKVNFLNKFKNMIRKFTWVFYLKKITNLNISLKKSGFKQNILEIVQDQSYLLLKEENQKKNLSAFNKRIIYIKKKIQFYLRVQKNDDIIPLTMDFLTVIIILIDLFIIPMSLSFTEFQNIQILDDYSIFCNFFFAFQIIQSFNIAILDQGNSTKDRKEIAINYIKSLFLIDIMSAIPYDLMVENSDKQKRAAVRILRFLRVFRAYKLFEKQKLGSFLDLVYDFIQNKSFLKILLQFFNLYFIIMTCAHWIACLLHFVRIQEVNANELPDIYQMDSVNLIIDDNFYSRYITCLYWAIQTMTTIGYGDVPLLSDRERILAMMVMFLSSGIYGYTLNKISSIILDLDSNSQNYKNQLKMMDQFMRIKDLDKNLKQGIRQYFDFIYQENGVLINSNKLEEDVFNFLSEGLKKDLILQKNQCLSINVPFIQKFSKKFIDEICIGFKEQLLGENDKILEEGAAPGNQLLIYLIQGRIKFHNEKTGTIFQIQTQQTMMGEIEFFQEISIQVSISSLDFCSVLQLRKQDFIQMFKNESFSQDHDIFHSLKQNCMINKNIYQLELICFCCNQNDHIIVNCPLLHYIPQKMTLLINHIQYSKLDYSNFTRIKQKFNSRQIYQNIQDYIQNDGELEIQMMKHQQVIKELQDYRNQIIQDYLNVFFTKALGQDEQFESDVVYEYELYNQNFNIQQILQKYNKSKVLQIKYKKKTKSVNFIENSQNLRSQVQNNQIALQSLEKISENSNSNSNSVIEKDSYQNQSPEFKRKSSVNRSSIYQKSKMKMSIFQQIHSLKNLNFDKNQSICENRESQEIQQLEVKCHDSNLKTVLLQMQKMFGPNYLKLILQKHKIQNDN